MRGPGCCSGSCLGLLLGAGLALGAVVALARWAPARFEAAVRWAAGLEPVAESPQAPGPPPPAGQPAEALRLRVRDRLRILMAGPRPGTAIKEPIEFSQQEVQAAISDPQGPLGGQPADLRVDLLPGRVRLSWKARPLAGREQPEWLARLPLSVAMSVNLAPRVEAGKLLCPVDAGRIVGVPLPGFAARALLRRLPQAPRLPPESGLALPPGIASIEIRGGRARLLPARPAPSPR